MKVASTIRKTVYWALLFCMVMNPAATSVCCGGENAKIHFKKFLTEMGDKFDCYFTVESVGKEGVLNNFILDAMVEIDTNAAQNLDTLVAWLSNGLVIQWTSTNGTNRISIVVDKVGQRKPIIRLRDTRLEIVSNYALNRQIGLQYAGSAVGLLDELTKVDANIEKQRIFSVGGGPIVMDYETQVRVSCTNEPIRDILTYCIPLSGYSRVIWSSCASAKQEAPSVIIQFYGARKSVALRSSPVAQ